MNPDNRRTLYGLLRIKTAADRLPFVFLFIVTHGKMAVPAFLIGYIFLCCLWLPVWGLSLVVSEYGVYVLAVGTVYFLGRVIIRLLAFPGSSHKVSGEIENEFSKYSVRMLDASLTCVIDICSAVIAQHNKAGNFAGYDVLSLWKRSKAYQDRVLGLYYDVLSHFYQDTISSLGLPATAKSSSQTTRYGNNKMLGDVGNLGNITTQARTDGRSLLILLGRILLGLYNLESQASGFLNQSGDKSVSEGAANTANSLLGTAKELRDILPSFKSQTGTIGDGDDEDEDMDGEELTVDAVRRKFGKDGGSVFSAAKGAFSSILPLLDPPLHPSIFGLDVLRGTVLSRYRGAGQIWVQRPSGGRIDVIHIPAIGWDLAHGRNGKAILYCNPNAGLSEVATGMSLSGGNIAPDDDSGNDICWTDFYTSKGYDMYLFNYAGFGRSQGSGVATQAARNPGCLACIFRIFLSMFVTFKPTPSSLRADATAVGAHLINSLGVDSLIIHGESIGGMAASGAARTLSHLPASKDKVKLLICDRTFCNLEAIAQRLIGAWTGPAIRLLTLYAWNTDVAGDYLASACPKVVANDAADTIIADPGSLRGGISMWKELRREISTKGVGWSIETPLDYRMADFESKGIPSMPYPQWPADKHLTLQESFHFAACARRIGKMATLERKVRSRRNSRELESGYDVGESSIADGTYLDGSDDLELSGLVKCWRAMSCCDGLCGAPLGSSVKQGNDWTVSWLMGTIVFGAQVVAGAAERRTPGSTPMVVAPIDFDCRPAGFEREETGTMIHPKPIPEVMATLKSVVDSGDESVLLVLSEIKYCIGIMEYIFARLSSATVVEEACRGLRLQDRLGLFLDLHCGHNNQYSASEKVKLEAILREAVGV